jgi:hypothetical protein
MHKTIPVLLAILLSLSLSGCFLAVAAGAGAAGGYVYKKAEDKGKVP